MDDDNSAAIDAVAESIRTGKPLMLVGSVGVGKTTLLAAVMRALWAQDRAAGLWSPVKSDRPYQSWMDQPAFFTTAAAFWDDVRSLWGKKLEFPPGREQFYVPEGVAAQCRRLFLDDLGAEPATEAAAQEIAKLLHDRDAASLPTWISTNLTARELRERYGVRTWDRLRASTPVVELLGASRRVAV